jgi:hypothetical protein
MAMAVSVAWVELPPLARPRAAHDGVVLADGRVLLAGGNALPRRRPRDGSCETTCASLADVELVDVARGLVEAAPPLREAREHAFVARSARGVVVAGGYADFG